MRNINWDDFRIALKVAQFGTLTHAGKALQMNHTTVLRHINHLEDALNIKLFIRHQRGYQLTDAGEIMATEVPKINEHFNQLINQMSNTEQNTHGHLRITTLSDYASLLSSALKSFRGEYPNIRIQIMATEQVIPVESGSAHISIRAGRQPASPDIIVKKLMNLNMDYYASDEYIEAYGLPKNTQEYSQHYWAMPSEEKHHLPFIKTVIRHLKNEQIIYQSNHFSVLRSAVLEGIAIGPIAKHKAIQYPQLKPLNVKINQDDEALWFIYHRDLKNNTRINALYNYLSESIKTPVS